MKNIQKVILPQKVILLSYVHITCKKSNLVILLFT